MYSPINTRLVLLPVFFLFFTIVLTGQSSSLHLYLDQGLSSVSDFDLKKDQWSGSYGAALGGEYYFPSGFYLKADLQLLSAQLSFYNNSLTLNSSDTATIGPNQASGTTRSKAYRLSYGSGITTNWKRVRFALDLAHSIEIHQRAETIAERPDGFFRDGGATAISQYGETFPFNDETWRLINNSNHQLQITGSVIAELSPKFGLGLFYRTDLLTRWVELQLEDVPGQQDFVTVERREARQAMAGLRLTYGFGGR